jgi:hypothetical protein
MLWKPINDTMVLGKPFTSRLAVNPIPIIKAICFSMLINLPLTFFQVFRPSTLAPKHIVLSYFLSFLFLIILSTRLSSVMPGFLAGDSMMGRLWSLSQKRIWFSIKMALALCFAGMVMLLPFGMIVLLIKTLFLDTAASSKWLGITLLTPVACAYGFGLMFLAALLYAGLSSAYAITTGRKPPHAERQEVEEESEALSSQPRVVSAGA